MTGPATRTVTHPGPDGTLWHFPLPRIVALSASLRRSRYTCAVTLAEAFPGEPTGGVLTVTWAGEGVRGSIRLVSVAPTSAGTHGSIVDHLPVAGLATRPLRPTSDRTRVLSLPSLRRAVYLAHGEASKDCPKVSADDWTAREAEALAVLGDDLERVQAA